MSNINCNTCTFCERDNTTGGLVCVRMPPTPAFVMMPPRIAGQPPQTSVVSLRPQVQESWYCGEYTSDLESAPEGDDKPEPSIN